MSATTDVFSKCLPAIRTNVGHCGLLTVCDAVVPAPSDLETLFKSSSSYRLMEALFMYQLELNACEAKQTPLQKFLLANRVDMTHKLSAEMINSGLARIRPYILAKRKGPINNNYWIAQTGLACDADGTTNGSGVDWKMNFTSPTSIPLDAKWFNAKERVFIQSLSAGGSATATAWEVVGIYNPTTITSDGFITVILKPQNSASFLPAARRESPTNGLGVRGTANISDFESFCSRPPGLITTTEDPFWIETTRDAICDDELYAEWLNLVKANNPLYANFFDLDTIEFNRQTGEDFYRRLAETFLRNKARPSQAISTVTSLEQINTVGPGSARCVGYKANAIGVYEQHVECERVVDAQGTKLNLPALWQALYKIQRIRKDTGSKAGDIIEIFMPSAYAKMFNAAMLNYYKAESQGMLQMFMDVNKPAQKAPLGFFYRDYPLLWPNLTVRVTTDPYFDDYAAAMEKLASVTGNVSFSNLGRQIWIVDWSQIYMGVFGSERVVNKVGDRASLTAVNTDYQCVMRVPTTSYTLMSLTWTAIAECVKGNLIIENLSNEVPEALEQGGVDYDENS